MPREYNNPQPYVIAREIYNKATNITPEPIREIGIQIIGEQFRQNKSEEEITDEEEAKHTDIIKELENIIANSKEDGLEPRIEIDGEYIHVSERPEIHMIVDKLRKLEPTEFEKYCLKLLIKLGAGDGTHTGNEKNDGGIDFIAYKLPIGGKDIIIPAHINSQTVVIGQAKRYTGNLITETDLREFIGGAMIQVFETRKRFGILTPIVYAYWTTSDFNPSARKFAKEMGLWYLNGLGLAQLSQRVGIGDPATVIV
ncbi:MAG: restriction endonuclease [Nitrospirota bacterium]